MPFDPRVTADARVSGVRGAGSLSKQRASEPIQDLIQEAASKTTFHIFNVGPWPQQINSGSYGTYYVPGCPLDKEYVECTRTIPGIQTEEVIADEARMRNIYSDGKKFADELVGDGRGRNRTQSLRHYGLFSSENAVPSSEEIYQAKTMLHAKCAEIVAEARNLFAQDRKQFSAVVKPERHFAAAKVLNLTDEVWMLEQKPSSRNKCRYCATMNDEEAVICAKCSKPIDIAKYKAMLAEDEAALAAPKRGPGRPRKEEEAEG